MSLYYEAEHLSAAKNKVSWFKNPQNLKNLIILGCCLLLPCLVSFYVVKGFNNQNVKQLAENEKKSLMITLSQKTKELELAEKSSNSFPFISESLPHDYKIKYLKELTHRNVRLEDWNVESNVKVNTSNESSESYDFTEAKSNITTTTRKKSIEELFNQAVSETGGSTRVSAPPKNNSTPQEQVKSLWELPSNIRRIVPSFVYSAHNYSSDTYKRSIVINGKTLREGGEIGKLQVKTITPNYTIFVIGGNEFSQRALDDYQAQP